MPPADEWFTSSYSSGASNTCVEVRCADGTVGVRDSKRIDGGTYQVTNKTWRTFVEAARHDQF